MPEKKPVSQVGEEGGAASLVAAARREAEAARVAWEAGAMARLVEVVQRLSAARALDDVMAIVRRAARELVGSDGATFVLRDGELCHYADEDAVAPLWKGQRFPMSACISGWAMVHRRAVAIPDIYADARIPHDAYRPTFVASLAMVPIRTRDPVGAIGVYWAARHDTSDAELRVLQALADTTSVAMENAALYTDLERRVEQRTRELAVANKELEAFCNAIAHDLRGPLFAIDAFSELLLQEHAHVLDSGGREDLERVRGAARRTQDILTGLLDLAGLTRAPLQSATVDLTAAAREIAAGLGAAGPERRVDFAIEDGLVARGDPRLLRLVVQNLLENAWKYTRARERGEIRFRRATLPDGGGAFVVADNGAGFAPESAQRLFLPFQRLHDEREFPGLGLGLACVQRIVQRHGGRVWAEGAPGRGACFFFSLP